MKEHRYTRCDKCGKYFRKGNKTFLNGKLNNICRKCRKIGQIPQIDLEDRN